MSGMLARVARHRMQHTYTLVGRVLSVHPDTGTTQDPYGNAYYTDAVAVTGLPGRWMAEEVGSLSPGGAYVRETPELHVPAPATLDEGDLVRDVRAADGTLVGVGPYRVLSVRPRSALGAVSEKVALLGGSEAV